MLKHFRLALSVALIALSAKAGENKFLGTLTSTGTSVNNSTTAVPFVIPAGSKVTMICTASTRVLVDNLSTATSGATKGLPLATSQIWPTSVGRNLLTVGGVASASMAVISASGTADCDVWLRDGNE